MFFFECYPDSHVPSCNFIFGLKKFDALESLLFGRLVCFNGKVNLFYSLFDSLISKSSFGDRMHTFLHDNVYYFCQNACLLGISFLICHLQLSYTIALHTSLKYNLNNLQFGFVGEKFIKVSFLDNSSM